MRTQASARTHVHARSRTHHAYVHARARTLARARIKSHAPIPRRSPPPRARFVSVSPSQDQVYDLTARLIGRGLPNKVALCLGCGTGTA
eukprot:6173240-Pleurochrysis_carterae.AAC.7